MNIDPGWPRGKQLVPNIWDMHLLSLDLVQQCGTVDDRHPFLGCDVSLRLDAGPSDVVGIE